MYDTRAASRARMMADLEKHFDAVKNASLSERERHVLREHLKLFVAEHPVSPSFSEHLIERLRVRQFQTTFSYFRLHPVMLSAVLVLFCGVGTSYAAEGALPGDSLYPVKVHVNEQIQGALAFSDEAKVMWSAERIERRASEASALAARGPVPSEARVALEKEIERSSKAFDATVLAAADATGSPATIAAAASTVERALRENEVALGQDPKEDVVPILAQVRAKAEKIQRVRIVAEHYASAVALAPAQEATATLMALGESDADSAQEQEEAPKEEAAPVARAALMVQTMRMAESATGTDTDAEQHQKTKVHAPAPKQSAAPITFRDALKAAQEEDQ